MTTKAKPRGKRSSPKRAGPKSKLKKTSEGVLQPRRSSIQLRPAPSDHDIRLPLHKKARVVGITEASEALSARVAAAIPTGTTRQEVRKPGDLPWCSQVRLLLSLPDGDRAVGTGWVIGPRTVITAGHCIYDAGWMRRIEITPGGDDSGFATVPGVHFDVPRAWREGTGVERQKADIGVVYTETPFSFPIVPLNYAVLSDTQLRNIPTDRISVAGFPSQPFGSFLVDRGSLTDFNAPFLHYNVETSHGQSGAPVLFWEQDDLPIVIGVHHFNVAPGVNRGIRIGSGAAALLRTWTH